MIRENFVDIRNEQPLICYAQLYNNLVGEKILFSQTSGYCQYTGGLLAVYSVIGAAVIATADKQVAVVCYVILSHLLKFQ